MPELPEVETVCRQLEPELAGSRIEHLEILDKRWCRPVPAAELERAVAGARIEGRSVPLPGFRIEFAEADRERFSGLGLVFDGLERLASFAEEAAGVEWRRLDERTGRIGIAALRLEIDCRSAS